MDGDNKRGENMSNQLQRKPYSSLPSTQSIINSEEYQRLSPEAQERMLEYLSQKRIDFSQEQERYMLEHASSNKDVDNYLYFLERQQTLQKKSDGLTVTYSSQETSTPTGKISSKTTNTTVSTGCLLPIVATITLLVLIL